MIINYIVDLQKKPPSLGAFNFLKLHQDLKFTHPAKNLYADFTTLKR